MALNFSIHTVGLAVTSGVLPLVLACSFDARGRDQPSTFTTAQDVGGYAGGESVGDEAADSNASVSDDGDDDGDDRGDDDGDGASTAGGADTTSTSEGESESDTQTGGETETETGMQGDESGGGCDTPVRVLEVADAQVVAPMMTAEDATGIFAYSVVEGAGSVTFSWEQPCASDYYVWGLVWDSVPGAHPKDPDSYWFSLDGAELQAWDYGCSSSAQPGGWSWQPVQLPPAGEPQSDCEGLSRARIAVASGAHTLTLRNREPSDSATSSAAVVRIVLTAEPDALPPFGDD